MTLEQIKEHLRKYNLSKGYGTEDADLEETLEDIDPVWEGNAESHRHWDEVDRVVEIDGLLIMFGWATTTGDMNAREKGWEFEWDTVSLASPKMITTTVYERI